MELTGELKEAFNAQVTMELKAAVVYRQLSIDMDALDLPGIAGETTKFERGKIQSAVTTHATLDLTPLIDTAAEQKARTAAKHFSIGMYGTSASAAVGIGYENRDYGIDLLVHPIEPSKFWGVGVRRRF